MAFDWAKLGGSVTQFLEAFRIVRVCPEKMDAPNEQLSLNLTTLAIVLAIFVLARRSIAGAETGVASDMFGTIVSASIMFVTGFVILIIDNASDVMTRVRKWGMFFVLTWIVSLVVVILVDGIAVWNHSPDVPTTVVIDSIFIPGSLPPLVKNSFRALIMGLIALTILLIKTRINDPQFRILSRCSITTIMAGLIMNTLLLQAFLYSNLI
jgi:hypothetical protein